MCNVLILCGVLDRLFSATASGALKLVCCTFFAFPQSLPSDFDVDNETGGNRVFPHAEAQLESQCAALPALAFTLVFAALQSIRFRTTRSSGPASTVSCARCAAVGQTRVVSSLVSVSSAQQRSCALYTPTNTFQFPITNHLFALFAQAVPC